MIQIKTTRLFISPAKYIRPYLQEMKRSHLSLEPEIYGGRQDFELREDQCVFTIVRRDSKEWLGGLSLHGIDIKMAKYEIGYWLRPEFTGNGYASEAVVALTRLLFLKYQAKKVEIHCDSRNASSIALARTLGFLPEAIWSRKDSKAGEENKNTSLVYARYDAEGLEDPAAKV